MNMKSMNKITFIAMQAIFLALISTFIFTGCSDTIDGTVNENQQPIVNFVNIPPDGHQFSRNPEVYWIGSDPDGLVDYYRYHIADTILVNDNGGVIAYADALHDTDWVQINIDHDGIDPQTTHVLPLTADTINPITNPITQYIILQAFDRENLKSLYASKYLNRNDNPPETRIFDITPSLPFVNSILEGGIVTGLRFSWEGTDPKDYDAIGLTPPPFDFEWRIFGPFDEIKTDSINEFLIQNILVSNQADVIHMGETFAHCISRTLDTTINSVDTTITIEECDTILLTQEFYDSDSLVPFFARDQILNVNDPLISDLIVASSFNGVDQWVQDQRDTIYNVYKNFNSDTTVEFNYVFWIRSRDDAFVKDITPAYEIFPVINPQYERDIAVIDFTALAAFPENHGQYTHPDTARAFWHNLIHEWGTTRPSGSVLFDTSVFQEGEETYTGEIGESGLDYIISRRFDAGIPIKYLLKHKVLILYNESYLGSGFVGASGVNNPEILTAMDAGINVWATWRNPGVVNSLSDESQEISFPSDYGSYFGVISMTYSAWIGKAFSPRFPADQMVRNEDFVGTYSIQENVWPSLDIDTTFLRNRLSWHPTELGLDPYYRQYLGFRDTVAAVPEVNWAARFAGTEVMYLYKSRYGAGYEDNYEGAPVGHRMESNFSRTVHFNFTLLTIEAIQAQTITNGVLDWLYETALNSSTIQADRYKDAPIKVSLDDARTRYEQRIIEQAEKKLNSGN